MAAAIDYIDSLVSTPSTRTSNACSEIATRKLEAVPGPHHRRHRT
jgi:hypothetical protein